EWEQEKYGIRKQGPDDWSVDRLHAALKETFGVDLPLAELKTMGLDEIKETLGKRTQAEYEKKESLVGPELMLFHQRMIMLQIVDTQWKDHLYALDHLKEGIGLRGYGQRDPLVEYKKESYNMFQALMDR